MSETSDCPSDGNFICTDYLFLKPEKAALFDLVRLLWSKDKQKHSFIETTQDLEQELKNFWYRWIVFISILLQKILQFIRIPMALAGRVIEFLVNLVYDNGGFLKLLINIITGKVVVPKPLSETYRSIIGYLDTRIDLDPKIPMDDPRYPPALSIMTAKSSYENPAFIKSVVEHHWKMEVLGRPYDFYNDVTVVAFCGTKPFNADDWCTDIDLSWVSLSGMGRAHAGFEKALGLQKMGKSVGWPKEIDMSPDKPIFAYYKVREVLRQICQESNNAKFIITGDKEFGEYMKKNLEAYNVRYCRYVYSNDIVPRVPFDDRIFMYKHFGPCLYYNSCYKGKEMPEEPNKNYCSLLRIIPMYVNAGWELIRGFILPYSKGPDYQEGWVQKAFRVFGLLIPGLSAHGPQDYDNVTRLGRMRMALPQHPRKKLN
ncbi:hypothetical protein Cgig2_028856 [Carnegiea gigantea]|uniref:Uncharacterized protein n=1 Tax=Carnegiea gigantea TaxID=171969 RepID=A0A9Q1KQL1_9CARY|nr:hypothetical protein Cgig2_028856 [Carnegiea gigantea]